MALLTTTPAGQLFAAVRQLQGLTVSLVTGGLANTALTLAGIKPGDHIFSALNLSAGTVAQDSETKVVTYTAPALTDITDTITITDLRARGTLTLANIANTNAATVQGVTYTFKTSPVAGVVTDLPIGADATACAASLAAAINAVEHAPAGLKRFKATSALGVVTIRATASGTAGNAYTISGTTHVTASGATLSGGAASGGISSTSATHQILLFWAPSGR